MKGLRPLGILNARELDQDPVLSLLLDRGLGDAELVDAVPDRLERLTDRELAQLRDFSRLEHEHHAAR